MDKTIEIPVKLIAIDQYVSSNIVKPTEKDVRGKGFVSWGENNDYPQYIDNLYDNCPTLHSLVDGTADYVFGAGTETEYDDLIFKLCKDYVKFGGFAINVISNKYGTPAELHYLDFSKCRRNTDRTKIYYADDWGKSFGRVKYIEYPAWKKDVNIVGNSIYYFSNSYNTVYPKPICSAAIIPCEIEKMINEFNLNLLNNGFSSNYIINFNNGRPTDEQMQEIEDEFYDKFTGVENTGRPMLVFNQTKENEASVVKIETDNFADKYANMVETSQQQIFTAFRCSPILFGIDQQKTGFNANEYKETFWLFNKTMIQPMQQNIERAFELLGYNIHISKFIMDFEL